MQELFGLPADDEGLLGSDGEDGTGEGAETVDRYTAIPAEHSVSMYFGWWSTGTR